MERSAVRHERHILSSLGDSVDTDRSDPALKRWAISTQGKVDGDPPSPTGLRIKLRRVERLRRGKETAATKYCPAFISALNAAAPLIAAPIVIANVPSALTLGSSWQRSSDFRS